MDSSVHTRRTRSITFSLQGDAKVHGDNGDDFMPEPRLFATGSLVWERFTSSYWNSARKVL